jgi:hypothetical protein
MGQGQGQEGRVDRVEKTTQDVTSGGRTHPCCSKGSLGKVAKAKEDCVSVRLGRSLEAKLKADYNPSNDSGSFLSLLAMTLVWGRQKLRSYRAATWPATEGVIETGEVSWGGSAIPGSTYEYAAAKLGYAYTVNDQYYSGYHAEWFGFAQDAWDYVDSWRGCKMRVRYHPRKPEVSVWREQEQVGGF